MEAISTISIGKRIFKVSVSAYAVLSDFESFLFKRVRDAGRKLAVEEALSNYLDLNMPPGTDVADYDLAVDAVRHIAEREQLDYFPEFSYRSRERLYRDTDNNILGGVCAGFGNYFNIDPVIIRLLFVILALFSPGLIIYIILWIVVPEQPPLYSRRPGKNRF
jgi:phage shock protein PspC (stress-responsive transcriptional regulator)